MTSLRQLKRFEARISLSKSLDCPLALAAAGRNQRYTRYPPVINHNLGWCNYIFILDLTMDSGQRQLQDKTRITKVLGSGASYIREFRLLIMEIWMKHSWAVDTYMVHIFKTNRQTISQSETSCKLPPTSVITHWCDLPGFNSLDSGWLGCIFRIDALIDCSWSKAPSKEFEANPLVYCYWFLI